MSLPLVGKRVLVTRPKDQADDFAARIRELGGEPILLPTISIAPPPDWTPVDRSIHALDTYDWVIFTSANGVAAFAGRMRALGVEPKLLADRRLAAIGPATARALQDVARPPDAMPTQFLADAIADVLGEVRGLRILLPRADIARQDLAIDLTARGAQVDAIDAYAVVAATNPESLQALGGTAPDIITLTSPSAARGLFALLQAVGLGQWMGSAELFCIGPVTAAAVADLGLLPTKVAEEHTTKGLIAALAGVELDD